MIRSPWGFECSNWNFVFKANNVISLDEMSFNGKIYRPELLNVCFDTIMVTFSDCSSSFDCLSSQKRTYHEVIIKLLTEYRGKRYIFPLITFVDDEFSLIRGYFLGFQKYMADVSVRNGVLSCNTHWGNISFRVKADLPSHSRETYPFLLEQNYNFGGEFYKKELVTLDVQDYELKGTQEVIAEAIQLEFIYNLVRDIKKEVHLQQVDSYQTSDSFRLLGVRQL